MISSGDFFTHVELTKIGSPYVIAAFSELSKRYKNIAGFEANGGFLLGSDVIINGQALAALPTRDAVLPAIMLLYSSRDKNISSLVEQLPCRYTHSDRLQNVTPEKSNKLIAMGIKNQQLLLNKIGLQDEIAVSLDTTDGIRMTLGSNSIVHLRPSGNAPELRCYAEANSLESAQHIVKRVLATIGNT
jgi:phosphomannomutase